MEKRISMHPRKPHATSQPCHSVHACVYELFTFTFTYVNGGWVSYAVRLCVWESSDGWLVARNFSD